MAQQQLHTIANLLQKKSPAIDVHTQTSQQSEDIGVADLDFDLTPAEQIARDELHARALERQLERSEIFLEKEGERVAILLQAEEYQKGATDDRVEKRVSKRTTSHAVGGASNFIVEAEKSKNSHLKNRIDVPAGQQQQFTSRKEFEDWEKIITGESVDQIIRHPSLGVTAITFDNTNFSEDTYYKRFLEKKVESRIQFLTCHYISLIQEKSEGCIKFLLDPLKPLTGEPKCDKQFPKNFQFQPRVRPCTCLPSECETAFESLIRNTYKNFRFLFGKDFGFYQDSAIHVKTNFTTNNLDYHPLQKALVNLEYPDWFITRYLKIQKSTITFQLFRECNNYYIETDGIKTGVYLSVDDYTTQKNLFY